MESNWVDFKAVKAAVSMEMVLDRYKVNWLRKKDSELRGRCPIHQGEGSEAFHVSITKNAFHCFSCKARGNVLDFVAAMEKCSVRDAGLKLQEWFAVLNSEQAPARNGTPAQTESKTPAAVATESRGQGTEKNPPLTFQLKGVDPSHSYLCDRGIRKQTAESFGLGFFSGKGSMSGRVVIPIHNETGELVAYAGRAVDGMTAPKYKLPAGFHKSVELFNLHRVIAAGTHEAVLVEGFFDCLKLHQAGFPALALMGSSLSAEQEELLCRHFKVAVLMFDGDDAGRQATDDCLLRLGRKLWVKAVDVGTGKQPDMFTAEELARLLGN
jgi:DNA primase